MGSFLLDFNRGERAIHQPESAPGCGGCIATLSLCGSCARVQIQIAFVIFAESENIRVPMPRAQRGSQSGVLFR